MSREILGSLGVCAGLVVAGGVEGELAYELTVEVDHADVLVCDQELDRAAFVGSAEPDVVELARVAHADLAVGVDFVLAYSEVRGETRISIGGFGLDAGAVGL